MVSRETCASHKFKGVAETFAYPGAKQYRFIDLTKTSVEDVRRNWHFLIQQNVSKANFIVSDRNEMPIKKHVIDQIAIFEGQKSKYVDVDESVAILNSFPLFVYEYLK